MTQQQLRLGQHLGHYQLTRLLGSGGFADVYLGEHIHLHTQAAVKVLHTRLSEEDIEAFRREAQMVAALQHLSIVRVLDFGVEDTIPYLVMDYAPNGSLRGRYPKGTRVPVSEIARVLVQVASALQYAHDRRLIHRDIKPENMLLGRNDEVLLGDFGIALITQSSHSLSTRDIAGTIAYMAPEQMQAHPRPASDQYALGIVVYEWLCGQRPFQGSYTEIAVKHSITPPPPLHERINLPIALEQIVMKALQKDPQQRFENVLTFAQAFAQVAHSVIQSQQLPTFLQSPLTSQPLSTAQSRPVQPALLAPSYALPPLPYPPDAASHPLQARDAPSVSRRGFIVGGIAGFLVAAGGGAWLYAHLAMRQQSPTIATSTLNDLRGLVTGQNKPLLTYSGHHGLVYSISWSPDGAFIASGSLDGEVQIWTADKGQLTFSARSTVQPPISDDFVQSLAWSRHAPPRVAVGFIDGTIQILDVSSRQRIGMQARSYTTTGVLSWSPDGKYLAVCKSIGDHAVVIYNVANWNSVFTYQDHTDSVHVVAWSPDGNYVASGSADTTIRVWEPLSGKTHMLYKGHSADIAAISWSSDSTKIVSTAQDYVVRVWQPMTGDTLYTHQYPQRAPMGKVAWSPNGQRVAAYPGFGSVDILSAQLAVQQTIQAGVTYDLSWSPDSTRIATANYNNIAQVWHVGT